MGYIQTEEERLVTVASVRVTQDEGAIISAYAKLRRTKVESIVSDLTKYFIKYHIQLAMLPNPSEEDFHKIITEFSHDYEQQN